MVCMAAHRVNHRVRDYSICDTHVYINTSGLHATSQTGCVWPRIERITEFVTDVHMRTVPSSEAEAGVCVCVHACLCLCVWPRIERINEIVTDVHMRTVPSSEAEDGVCVCQRERERERERERDVHYAHCPVVRGRDWCGCV